MGHWDPFKCMSETKVEFEEFHRSQGGQVSDFLLNLIWAQMFLEKQ